MHTRYMSRGGIHACCVFQSSSAVLILKVNLKYSSQSTVKPLYLFDVLSQISQGQRKILAKRPAIIRLMQFNNFFGQDFDRG